MVIEPIENTSPLSDPLLTRTPVTHEKIFFPYGFPVRIATNSAEVIAAAEISWSTCRCRFERPPLDIRCFVSASDSPACSQPPVFRLQGNLLSIVIDCENFACLDLNAGFCFGWVTNSTVASSEYFRQCMLDAMIHSLLDGHDLVPPFFQRSLP